jgi:hypothetical protein
VRCDSSSSIRVSSHKMSLSTGAGKEGIWFDAAFNGRKYTLGKV